jgi:RND superfamily putative drug exporter
VPIAALVLGAVGLVVIALPMVRLRLGSSDASDSPDTSTEKKAYDLIAKGFGPGYNNPFLGVISLPPGQTANAQTNSSATTPGVSISAASGVAGWAALTAVQTDARAVAGLVSLRL